MGFRFLHFLAGFIAIFLTGCDQFILENAANNPEKTNSTLSTLVSVSVSPLNVTLGVGGVQNITVTGKYDNGTTQNLNALATWVSETPSIATVTQAGLVTALGPGLVGINISYGGKGGQVLVLVSQNMVTAPTFLPVGGTYPTAQSVSLNSVTPGAVIRYTTDGSIPNGSSALYVAPITVSATQVVRAFAQKTGMLDSNLSAANYTITGTVASPAFSPAGGTYTSAQSVSLSSATAGAEIHYTLDGSNPTASSPTYSSALTVSAMVTIKALAIKSGWNDSSVTSASYAITGTVASPTFSPGAGTYTSAQSVSLSSATTGAEIQYTLDGSNPTASSPTYSGALTISATGTIKALAIKSGWNDSSVASAAYTITGTVASPTFSPAAGTYPSAQSVTLSSATTGAEIHYTLDGTAPTASSATYSSPLTISSSSTLKALAIKTGWNNSAPASAAYTITGTVASPTFSPLAGTYATVQSVNLSSATPGAEIHYTLNGSNPTATSPTFSSVILISSTTTVKAIAIKAGWNDSAIASAVYTITGTVAAPTFSPAGGNYTTPQAVTLSTSTSGAEIHFTLDGSEPTPTSATYSTPLSISATTTIKALAVKADWINSAVATSTYTFPPVPFNPTYDVSYEAATGRLNTVNSGIDLTSKFDYISTGGNTTAPLLVMGDYSTVNGSADFAVTANSNNFGSSYQVTYPETATIRSAMADFGGKDYLTSLRTDPLQQSRFVAAGYSFDGTSHRIALARFLANGVLDTSFGGGTGKVLTKIGGGAVSHDIAHAVAISETGKIWIVGYSFDGSKYNILVARYLDTGVLDQTFSSIGYETYSFSNSNAYGLTLTPLTNDRLLIGGRYFSLEHNNFDFFVIGIGANGGALGVQVCDFGGQDLLSTVEIDSWGKILLGGKTTTDGVNFRMALCRFNSNLNIDTTFGNGTGKVVLTLPTPTGAPLTNLTNVVHQDTLMTTGVFDVPNALPDYKIGYSAVYWNTSNQRMSDIGYVFVNNLGEFSGQGGHVVAGPQTTIYLDSFLSQGIKLLKPIGTNNSHLYFVNMYSHTPAGALFTSVF